MGKKPKKTDVPRDLRQSGELCLAFANTAAVRRDDRYRTPPPPAPALGSYGDLVTWGQRLGIVDATGGETLRRVAAERPAEAATVFARALELRGAMLRVFTAEASGEPAAAADLELMKRALARAMPAREVAAAAAGYGWIWGGDGEALDRVLWPVVYSAAELLVSDDLRKVRQCAGEHCPRLFVARRRRFFCDPNICGNRDRGRRHYRKFASL